MNSKVFLAPILALLMFFGLAVEGQSAQFYGREEMVAGKYYSGTAGSFFFTRQSIWGYNYLVFRVFLSDELKQNVFFLLSVDCGPNAWNLKQMTGTNITVSNVMGRYVTPGPQYVDVWVPDRGTPPLGVSIDPIKEGGSYFFEPPGGSQ